MDLLNCPNCGMLYMKNSVRDVCDKCYREEEALFDKVYNFLRKQENRASRIERVSEVTGAPEKLLYKWVKRGRLHTAHFPNLGYPCDRCGKIIREGKLCEECTTGIKGELDMFDKEQERLEQLHKSIYYAQDRRR
ncbi:TIGR03826 family flagellar region protein [Lederbergia wuyishanensis]|uniref:Flagellar operon protein (TIGR03826 family) n=1 Tax=Lederbergia wuyishanensis TaxID=1347903 RepID=A0ABU0D8X9_9BACI|nr:TIGR03826 family flagellar region protein [Lederbergia wuyishanensis]MCJ8007585.1 hypothetical protein [Lederbergia wuyishanensis]MDQ0344832.1 flagellar operon protein (TIGR03826 family) [Lederbergia wuyishanensis]